MFKDMGRWEGGNGTLYLDGIPGSFWEGTRLGLLPFYRMDSHDNIAGWKMKGLAVSERTRVTPPPDLQMKWHAVER